MRKIIIDTDTASDDAVALIMVLKSDNLKVEAITTVAGNCTLENATKNALMTIEVTGVQTPPVYKGADRPLIRNIIDATCVHGEDGMGDCDLIHPTIKAESKHAMDAIIDIVRDNPGEIEMFVIGPATNIAIAISKAPDVMATVKHIYIMGTGGYYAIGNVTPAAEFNVYADAEAFKIMMNLGVPTTVVGFDICLGDTPMTKQYMEDLVSSGVKEAEFAVKCNKTLLEYNLKKSGEHIVDLPDAVAAGVMLWDDIVISKTSAKCFVGTSNDEFYGGVLFTDCENNFFEVDLSNYSPANCTIIRKIDAQLYLKRQYEILTK